MYCLSSLHRKRLGEYILRGILVAVMNRSTLRADPPADLEVLDLRVLISTGGTCLTRRKEYRHLKNLTAMFKGLVFEHRDKGLPRCIGYGFGKMMISYHSFHVERLQSDDLVFVHQLGRYFMKMIAAAVIDLLVDAYNLSLLLLQVRTFEKRPLPYGLAVLRIACDIHLDHA